MKRRLLGLAATLAIAIAIESNYFEVHCCVCGFKSLCGEYNGYPICWYCWDLRETEFGQPGALFEPEQPAPWVLDGVDLNVTASLRTRIPGRQTGRAHVPVNFPQKSGQRLSKSAKNGSVKLEGH